MSSEKERIRVIQRKTKPSDKLTTMNYRGKLYFAEQRRAPVKRGNLLLITDIKEPITSFDDGDYYWIALYSKVKRTEDKVSEMLAAIDKQQAEHEARLQAIADEFQDELKSANRMMFSYRG